MGRVKFQTQQKKKKRKRKKQRRSEQRKRSSDSRSARNASRCSGCSSSAGRKERRVKGEKWMQCPPSGFCSSTSALIRHLPILRAISEKRGRGRDPSFA